jgi:hypothetical protein
LSRLHWEELWKRSATPPVRCLVWLELLPTEGDDETLTKAIVLDPVIHMASN